ncbi:MAG: hypothetical protein KC422_11340 [Trueperaceae bacterium]|nr:hypothetical protein [Trueperaceae bacterium]
MTRFGSSLRTEVIVQFRQGFYFVSLFVIVIFSLLLAQLPKQNLKLEMVIPGFLVINFVLTTFFFVGALVLLEKAEGSLFGLAVSPLLEYEYLLAKVVSLTGLAALESLAVVGLVFGWQFKFAYLLLGMLVLGALYTLLGFSIMARFRSINDYLLPAGLAVTLLILPLLDVLGIWHSSLFYLHPIQPALLLMQAAFRPLTFWELCFAGLASFVWLGLVFVWAQEVFRRIVRAGG